jgi:hypothetical protein
MLQVVVEAPLALQLFWFGVWQKLFWVLGLTRLELRRNSYFIFRAVKVLVK